MGRRQCSFGSLMNLLFSSSLPLALRLPLPLVQLFPFVSPNELRDPIRCLAIHHHPLPEHIYAWLLGYIPYTTHSGILVCILTYELVVKKGYGKLEIDRLKFPWLKRGLVCGLACTLLAWLPPGALHGFSHLNLSSPLGLTQAWPTVLSAKPTRLHVQPPPSAD